MVRITKRNLRQARAVSARGSTPRPPARGGLRAIAAATGLAVMVSLSPELTQAPTRRRRARQRPGWRRRRRPASQCHRSSAGRPRARAGPPAVAARSGRLGAPDRRGQPRARARRSSSRQPSTPPASAQGRTASTFAGRSRRPGRLGREQRRGARRPQSARRPAARWSSAASRRRSWRPPILELVDEGRLSLDDSVRRFLPDADARSAGEITIRQLLDHTSGLADVFNDATRRGLEEHPERAWSTERAAGEPPRPVVPAGRGLGVRQHELLPARPDRRAPDRVDPRPTSSSAGSSIRSASARRASCTATDPSSPLAPAWTTIFWASGAMTSSAGRPRALGRRAVRR